MLDSNRILTKHKLERALEAPDVGNWKRESDLVGQAFRNYEWIEHYMQCSTLTRFHRTKQNTLSCARTIDKEETTQSMYADPSRRMDRSMLP